MTNLIQRLKYARSNPRFRRDRRPSRELRDETAMRIAHIATWEYDLVLDEFRFTDAYYALHATTAREVGGYTMKAADFAARYVHPEDAPMVTLAIRLAAETKDPDYTWETEARILRADGASHWIRVWFRIQKDDGGQTIKLYGVIQDIHEQKEAELALRRNEATLRLTQFAVEHSLDAVYYMDAEGRIIYVNEAACQALGYTRAELMQMSIPDINPNFSTEIWSQYWAEMRQRPNRFMETTHKTKAGRIFPVEVRSARVEFEGSEYHCSFVRDISEQKAREQALRESQARNIALLNANPDLMFLTSRDGTFLEVHTRHLENLALPPEQFLNKNIKEVFPPDFTGRFMAISNKVFGIGDQQIFEYQMLMNNELRYYEARVVRCDQETLLTLVRDIQERKESEQALRQANREVQRSLAFIRGLLAAIPIPVFSKDTRGRFTGCNARFCELAGLPEEKIVGKTVHELFPGELADKYDRQDRELLADKSQQIYEYVTPAIDGKSRIAVNYKSVFYDENNTVAGIVGAVVDITERKLAENEIRRLNAELEQRVIERTAQLEDANREVEAFAYSVSHDLRAPLRALDGFSQILIEDYENQLDQAGKEYLQRIRAAAQRMGLIIDGLLRLSRLSRADLQVAQVNLSQMVREIGAELREALPDHPVEVNIQPGLTANGDATLLRTALENLLRNAWKFTSRRPAPHIHFGAQSVEGEQVYFIRDNGVGFDMAYAGKLFGAFQRLHDVQEFPGTGIGLATVRRIIYRHGGRIWAEAQPDQGATFYFTLPGPTLAETAPEETNPPYRSQA